MYSDLKGMIFADCQELKQITKADAEFDSKIYDPEDCALKTNWSSRAEVIKGQGHWILVSKRYPGEIPFCTIKLSCENKLTPEETAGMRKMLATIIAENKKADKKDKTSGVLYLSQFIIQNPNRSDFMLTGFLKWQN